MLAWPCCAISPWHCQPCACWCCGRLRYVGMAMSSMSPWHWPCACPHCRRRRVLAWPCCHRRCHRIAVAPVMCASASSSEACTGVAVLSASASLYHRSTPLVPSVTVALGMCMAAPPSPLTCWQATAVLAWPDCRLPPTACRCRPRRHTATSLGVIGVGATAVTAVHHVATTVPAVV